MVHTPDLLEIKGSPGVGVTAYYATRPGGFNILGLVYTGRGCRRLLLSEKGKGVRKNR